MCRYILHFSPFEHKYKQIATLVCRPQTTLSSILKIFRYNKASLLWFIRLETFAGSEKPTDNLEERESMKYEQGPHIIFTAASINHNLV